jgi:hypothetical protein
VKQNKLRAPTASMPSMCRSSILGARAIRAAFALPTPGTLMLVTLGVRAIAPRRMGEYYLCCYHIREAVSRRHTIVCSAFEAGHAAAGSDPEPSLM